MTAKILIVDDSEVVLSVFGIQLEAQGFSVTTSISAQSALEELALASRQESPFDLLITDLEMPEHRGTALIRAVRELEQDDGVADERRLPILLLSGIDLSTISAYEQDDLMSLGVSYLDKENANNQLIATVVSMLCK